jgi:hypothetical protein
MAKIPLFLETAKSYPNKIAAYIRTGNVLSDPISYILFIPSKFFNEKYPLIINLLGSVLLTSTVRNPLTKGAAQTTSGCDTTISIPEDTRLFQVNDPYSKRQFILPVQIFELWYNCFLNNLLLSVYTPFLKLKHTHYCMINLVPVYSERSFLNKNDTTLTCRCNFTI